MDELQKKIIEFRDKRNWQQHHNARTIAASISIEAAELLEIFQWVRDENLDEKVKEDREHIEEEIADIFIYLLTLCHDLGIDYKKAIEDKIVKNGVKYPEKP